MTAVLAPWAVELVVEMPLAGGQVAIIDAADVGLVGQFAGEVPS